MVVAEQARVVQQIFSWIGRDPRQAGKFKNALELLRKIVGIDRVSRHRFEHQVNGFGAGVVHWQKAQIPEHCDNPVPQFDYSAAPRALVSASHSLSLKVDEVTDSPWRPGATAMRSLTQSTFVDEDDRATLFFCVFFSSGQRSCFQWRILSSSRSRSAPPFRSPCRSLGPGSDTT
jgi:hypothetical protein